MWVKILHCDDSSWIVRHVVVGRVSLEGSFSTQRHSSMPRAQEVMPIRSCFFLWETPCQAALFDRPGRIFNVKKCVFLPLPIGSERCSPGCESSSRCRHNSFSVCLFFSSSSYSPVESWMGSRVSTCVCLFPSFPHCSDSIIIIISSPLPPHHLF
jgi:hypothetical protein